MSSRTHVAFAAVVVAAAMAQPAASGAALPDGRIYEQVSPANKNGNVVRGLTGPNTASFGLAAEDGDAVVFVASGAMGTAYSGTVDEFVARRSPAGWLTTSAVPHQLGTVNVLSGSPLSLVPSHDFSRFVFGAFSPYVSTEPLDEESSSNIFLSGNPAIEPTWIAEPIAAPPGFNPTPAPGHNMTTHDYLIAGGSPDLSTVYFTYSGTLIPQDGPRAANVGAGEGGPTDPWGFYEWTGGTLREAGVLPGGQVDAFGAVPAAIAGGGGARRTFSNPFDQAQTLDNEVSADGSRAFFMSPDPVASSVTDPEECASHGPCTTATPELYARKTAPDGTKSTVLVSRSELAGHFGEPAADGVVKVPNAPNESVHSGETYVYASPDGSQAFFASVDQLTSAAPADGSVKEYDFDVNTDSLTYLPGVSGSIVVSSSDGSDFLFENTATTPAELALWAGRPGGGQITTITPLPPAQDVGGPFEGALDISGARASADGSVFVFRTNSPLPEGFNNAGGFSQVYRYDLATGLTCVSCPPTGVTPSGDARVSYDNAEEGKPSGSNSEPMTTLDTRVMSSDGERVFFDTPDPLVPQDTNGKRDVYEWENGTVSLLSSGKSTENSYLLDSGASGDDIFFTTASGLVANDVDDAYDVYDARVPRPGDSQPPAAASCQGEACQGSPIVPPLTDEPASASFNGAGNVVPPESKPPGHRKRRARHKRRHRHHTRRRTTGTRTAEYRRSM